MTDTPGRQTIWVWITYCSIALLATVDLFLLASAFAGFAYCLVVGSAYHSGSRRVVLTTGWISMGLIAMGWFTHDWTAAWQIATRGLAALMVLIMALQCRATLGLAERCAAHRDKSGALQAELARQKQEDQRKRQSLISVMEDTRLEIERRKMLEAELKASLLEIRQANADLESFAYIASHDLQEPLRNIVSFSELLQEDLQDGDQEAVATDLHYIVNGASRMSRLIDDLLAYSRAGRGARNMEQVDLNDCIAEALENLSTLIKETSVAVVVDPQPSIEGDRRLLVQLYQNLIGNAVKFSRQQPDPQVRITATQAHRRWVLGVEDNGIGIAPEYLEQVFAPFKKLHSLEEYEGSGIGLAICKRIIDHHNGQIWVDSCVGSGSHFMFTLEIEEQTHEHHQAA